MKLANTTSWVGPALVAEPRLARGTARRQAAALHPTTTLRLSPRLFRTVRPRLALCAAALWLLAIAPALRAATPEYQVKAVFLFNFAPFVEWPAAAFANAQSPLVIGVLGDDPFDLALDEAVRGEKVNGRPIAVRHYRRVEDIADCHILFISRSEAPRLGEIFARLRDRSILTVSDADGFALAGGMIRFVTENNKTRFGINVEAAKAAHLTLSSKLLRPAEIVAPGKD